MRRSSALLLVGAVLIACLLPTRAALGDVVDAVGSAVGSAAGAVGDALSGAWDSVKGAVESVYTSAECKAVEFGVNGVDLETCTRAPLSGLCTSDCKANLDKMPQACIQKVLDAVASAGDVNTTQRWESQLTACNITYTPPTNAAVGSFGNIALPLVVLAASMVFVELLRP